MTLQEQIEKEFNKDKNSYIDLYLILDLLISQKSKNMQNGDLKGAFFNSEIIRSIISLTNTNPDKFKFEYTFLGPKSEPTHSLYITIYNESGIEKFNLIQNMSQSGNDNFMLEHNKNNIQRRLYLIKELESTFKIPLTPPLKTHYERQHYFQFNINSNIKDDLTKREYIKSPDKDEQLNSIFSTLGNSINNQSISEAFDLLNIQYDFVSEEFKKSIIYFFDEENSTTKHDNLLLKIKKNNENKNKIKLKN